jgi:hypothetical protein
MSINTLKFIEGPYSYEVLFSKNHIKTTQIIEKIRQGKINEILNGFIRINDVGLIVEPKYLKNFANQYTYDLIFDYVDRLINHFLVTKCNTINMYVNIQSISFIDLEKNIGFLKNLATFFSSKYPNILNKCYVYNASILYETLFKMMKNFIDKETLAKLQFIKE